MRLRKPVFIFVLLSLLLLIEIISSNRSAHSQANMSSSHRSVGAHSNKKLFVQRSFYAGHNVRKNAHKNQSPPLVPFPNYEIAKIGSEYDNGYPESRYNFILAQIQRVYGEVIAQRGGQLKIQADWTDGAVNMWAWRWGNDYWLEIPGGMSRYFLINEEGFVLSICHELGHLLGGLPTKGSSRQQPISNEGQADYFASAKCMRRILPEFTPYKVKVPSEAVKNLCKDIDHVSKDVCHRTLIGGLSLTSYYARLERSEKPKYSTPSSVVVDETMNAHPPAQCRLDTYLAGLRCKVSYQVPISFENERDGACVDREVGHRPTCFFKPKNTF